MRLAKRISSILVILALAFVVVPMVAQAANLWPAKTVITFSQSIELPGIALSPGTYVFVASDSGLVQVFDAKEKTIFGAFMTVPAYRVEPSDQISVKFEERTAGSPEALISWTNAGDVIGHEFLYNTGNNVEAGR